MTGQLRRGPDRLAAVMTGPDSGSYVILVTDPVTGARFAYGPYGGQEMALAAAARLRADFPHPSLDDLVLEVLMLIPLSWGAGEVGA
jgi:hypothetical protein